MGNRGSITDCNAVEGMDTVFINSLMFRRIPEDSLTASFRENIVYIQILSNKKQPVSRKRDIPTPVKSPCVGGDSKFYHSFKGLGNGTLSHSNLLRFHSSTKAL